MKNIFIKSTLILIISGFITKLLSMVIKILVTRSIGTEGIALYALLMPTYSLLVAISIFCMPHAISKLVAEKRIRSKNILSSALIITLLLNFITILLVIILSNTIATTLLKEPLLKNLLIISSLSLPFISISSIIKGYFFGLQKMTPNAISNILEQMTRIVLIIILLPIILPHGIISSIIFILILNIICEIISIIILIKFLPTKINITKLSPNIDTSKELLNISIPSVSGKLVGNITYFLEPIILTNLLLYLGYSKDFITTEYGIFISYSLSLLLMPAFFISAISQSLIPEISKYHVNKNKTKVKKRLNQALLFSLILGIIFTSIIYFFNEQILYFLFKTTEGSNYLKVLTPFFLLFYIESPLYSFLLAIDKVKQSSIISIIGSIIKLISLIIFIFLNTGMYSLIYAEIINILFIIITCTIIIKRYLKKPTY